MRKANYLKLKEQLGIIREIEELYVPAMSRGDNPQIDGKTYQEAIFDQAGILIISLEEVLEDEEDYLE